MVLPLDSIFVFASTMNVISKSEEAENKLTINVLSPSVGEITASVKMTKSGWKIA